MSAVVSSCIEVRCVWVLKSFVVRLGQSEWSLAFWRNEAATSTRLSTFDTICSLDLYHLLATLTITLQHSVAYILVGRFVSFLW